MLLHLHNRMALGCVHTNYIHECRHVIVMSMSSNWPVWLVKCVHIRLYH